MKKVVSLRMEPDELAKARDGLLAKGINKEQTSTLSQILRLTFYYGLMALCDDPKSPATPESNAFIYHRLGQNKFSGHATLNDLLNKDI